MLGNSDLVLAWAFGKEMDARPFSLEAPVSGIGWMSLLVFPSGYF